MFKHLFKAKAYDIASPMAGKLIPLDQVNDPVFSSRSMGDGFAIVMSGDRVVSPVNGEVMMVFPTKHAIGILGDDGIEYLLHIGIDTVNLKGEGFTSSINVGDKVKQGDLLLTIDRAYMEQNSVDLTSPVLFTNLRNKEVRLLVEGEVTQGQKDLLSVVNI